MSERDPVVSSAGIKQWQSIIGKIVAINRFRRSSSSQLQDAAQNPHTSGVENSRNSDGNNDSSRESTRLQSEAGSTDESKLEFVKNTRKALVELLSSYGIILTLLASITFVAVLQPPGSFEPDGFVRSSKLVAAFMFFATSSFLLACTGLLTVAVGSAMMLRPRFFKQFEEIRVPLHTHHQIGLDGNLHPSQPNHSHECQPLTADVTYDNLPIMGKIILDNLYRTRRLRIYMGLSLLSCVTAFLCAGFAVTKSSSHGFYSLVAAIVLGGFPFLLEIVKMFMGFIAW